MWQAGWTSQPFGDLHRLLREVDALADHAGDIAAHSVADSLQRLGEQTLTAEACAAHAAAPALQWLAHQGEAALERFEPLVHGAEIGAERVAATAAAGSIWLQHEGQAAAQHALAFARHVDARVENAAAAASDLSLRLGEGLLHEAHHALVESGRHLEHAQGAMQAHLQAGAVLLGDGAQRALAQGTDALQRGALPAVRWAAAKGESLGADAVDKIEKGIRYAQHLQEHAAHAVGPAREWLLRKADRVLENVAADARRVEQRAEAVIDAASKRLQHEGTQALRRANAFEHHVQAGALDVATGLCDTAAELLAQAAWIDRQRERAEHGEAGMF